MRTEQLPNGYTLLQPNGLLRLTLDASAVAREAAIRAPAGARIADVGAGVGAVTILLCSMRPDVRITAFELCARADAVLRDNIAQNSLACRAAAVRGDVRETAVLHGGVFDAVVCNPPYRTSGGTAADAVPQCGSACADGCAGSECAAAGGTATRDARHDGERSSAALPPDDLAAAARTLLRPRGRLFAVVGASRVLDYCAAFGGAGVEPKRLTFIAASAAKKPSLVLIEAVRDARGGGLIIEPLLLADEIARFFAL